MYVDNTIFLDFLAQNVQKSRTHFQKVSEKIQKIKKFQKFQNLSYVNFVADHISDT